MPESPTEFGSGTRLAAHYYDLDGALVFIDFHDAKLDVDCGFATAEDGTTRCLPRHPLGYDRIVYTDDTCTKPAATTAPCPSAYAFDRVDLGCVGGVAQPGTRVYRRRSPSVTTAFRRGNDGSCVQLPAGAAMYDPIEPVAPSEFVAGTARKASCDDRLGVSFIFGDDGSFVVSELYEVSSGDACLPSYLDCTSPPRCLPYRSASVVSATVHADSSCAPESAATVTDRCETPRYAFENVRINDQCVSGGVLYSVGSELDPSALYDSSSGACMPLTPAPQSTLRYFAVGAMLPADTFPPVDMIVRGSGAVQAMGHTCGHALTAASTVLAPSGASCVPFAATDGHRYCAGFLSSSFNVPTYEDPSCTKRIDNVLPGLAFGYRKTDQWTAACTPLYEVFSVGAAVTPATLYSMDGGACTGRPNTTAMQYFEVSDPVDPAQFLPRIVDKTDPVKP